MTSFVGVRDRLRWDVRNGHSPRWPLMRPGRAAESRRAFFTTPETAYLLEADAAFRPAETRRARWSLINGETLARRRRDAGAAGFDLCVGPKGVEGLPVGRLPLGHDPVLAHVGDVIGVLIPDSPGLNPAIFDVADRLDHRRLAV